MSPIIVRREFRAALAMKEMTATQFAGMIGVSKPHLSMVLSGKRKSDKVMRAVHRFIAVNVRRGVA